jgi:hypothetical protein
MSGKTRAANIEIFRVDYHPHRIHSSGSTALPSPAPAIDISPSIVGQSYDLGDVLTLDPQYTSPGEAEDVSMVQS